MLDPGRWAYLAYADALDWTNARDEKMPEWGELPDHQRQAWRLSAGTIIDRIENEQREAEQRLLDLENFNEASRIADSALAKAE